MTAKRPRERSFREGNSLGKGPPLQLPLRVPQKLKALSSEENETITGLNH